MKHAQKPWSRWHRPGVAAATVFAAAMAVTGAVGTGAAHADTLPNGNGVNLGTYPIPTSAPAYQPGGDLLPTGLGTLGNATEMFIPNEPNQDLSVQGGSTAWGTPVVMATSTGAASQTWYFQLVGTVEVGEVEYGTVSDTSYTSVQNVPVYRIINFNGSAPTCLDGYGGGGAAWTNVDSYGATPTRSIRPTSCGSPKPPPTRAKTMLAGRTTPCSPRCRPHQSRQGQSLRAWPPS